MWLSEKMNSLNFVLKFWKNPWIKVNGTCINSEKSHKPFQMISLLRQKYWPNINFTVKVFKWKRVFQFVFTSKFRHYIALLLICAWKRNFLEPTEYEHLVPSISELSGFVDVFLFYSTDQSKGLLDALAAFFIKLDHAASRQCIKDWETFSDTLRMYFATHEKNSLGELWNDRSDWYPPNIKRQRLTGNWPNTKLMHQDGSSGKVWLLLFLSWHHHQSQKSGCLPSCQHWSLT